MSAKDILPTVATSAKEPSTPAPVRRRRAAPTTPQAERPRNARRGDTAPALKQAAVARHVQREAVQYLLGDGARSLEPYAAPAVIERVSPFGGYRAIERLQADIVKSLMTGPNVVALESQKRRDPAAYSPTQFGNDLSVAVWGELAAPSPTQRALQRVGQAVGVLHRVQLDEAGAGLHGVGVHALHVLADRGLHAVLERLHGQASFISILCSPSTTSPV